MSSRTYNRKQARPAPLGASVTVPTKKVDGWLLGLTIALVIIGLLAVYDASYVKAGESRYANNDSAFFLKRHLVWATIGMGAFLGGMHLGYWKLRKYAFTLLLAALFSLVLVLIPAIGQNVGGARRWLDLGPIRFQPSEFAKVALVIYLAHYLAANKKRIRHLTDGFIPALIPMALVCFLVLAEPDMGTMLATAAVGMALMYAGGADRKHVACMVLLAGPDRSNVLGSATDEGGAAAAFMVLPRIST